MSLSTKIFLIALSLLNCPYLSAQDDNLLDLAPNESSEAIELVEDADLDLLKSAPGEESSTNLPFSKEEEFDDLESLKKDSGELLFNEDKEAIKIEEEDLFENPVPLNQEQEGKSSEDKAEGESEEVAEGDAANPPPIFDVGKEEKELLYLAQFVQKKISPTEWNEIYERAKVDSYEVQKGDWLWKISKTLFGSGFYYAKIWSLNPYIKNPHLIEPGMTLVFDTGSATDVPSVKVGSFAQANGKQGRGFENEFKFEEFGDNTTPDWLNQRKELLDQGAYFQYASEETYDDLIKLGEQSLNKEYRKYDPPKANIVIEEPGDSYDEAGFDKTSRVSFKFKEGYFLNSFITTNIVQDLGYVDYSRDEKIFISRFDKVYVRFDNSVAVKTGDLFSLYAAEGMVKNPVSDREGYRYTVRAHIKAIKKIEKYWECQVEDVSGIVERGLRVTVYTPKIDKILKTFSKRSVEAAIIESYRPTAGNLSSGDVVYLDRGRADGVEMGTIFDIYSFLDKGKERRISYNPTYKIGELTVITLTDNFATALITNSSNEIPVGSIALTKSPEAALESRELKNKSSRQAQELLKAQGLDELDVELNLDETSEALLERADKIDLNEEELQELERQEREKSILKDQDRDVKELERLEGEIENAESEVYKSKVDEDKFLEQQDLNKIEKDVKEQDPNSFEPMDEVEKELGKKFIDEQLSNKDNPYGLTEHDLEEIDELLNNEGKKAPESFQSEDQAE